MSDDPLVNAPVTAAIVGLGSEAPQHVTVKIDHAIVGLLSDQLYQSPLKAIEELVVNGYDADATTCRVSIPSAGTESEFVAVFDDGEGMDFQGLSELWTIGLSPKKLARGSDTTLGRKLIGKFGIGKLATRAIANRVTHVTKHAGSAAPLAVTVDYTSLEASHTDTHEMAITQIDDIDGLLGSAAVAKVLVSLGLSATAVAKLQSWTLVLLEDLRTEQKLVSGRLRWVLSTAMPMAADFNLFLNGELVESSKDAYDVWLRFNMSELPEERIRALEAKWPEQAWRLKEGAIVSNEFPAGIRGDVVITRRSLVGSKSDDVRRSHGFFIRVRNRLVNEDDDLFGLTPRSFSIWNRFRADIFADDLDSEIKAPREGTSQSPKRTMFQAVLLEVLNEARVRFNAQVALEDERRRKAREHEREWVAPRFVEHPIADVLGITGASSDGADADSSWFYLDFEDRIDIGALIDNLYSGRRAAYRFEYENRGRAARVVQFFPAQGRFVVNDDHELVREFAQDAKPRRLLEDFLTAEALLEVYLRENGVSPAVAGEILEQRDQLIRSLASERAYSLRALAQDLRDAADDERALETAVVAAARALGFVAKQVSGPGQPDGIARYGSHRREDKVITLEAKSSSSTPSLQQLDFAGLQEHMERYGATGCLLVAPVYPGQAEAENRSAAAKRARNQGVSCWTVAQLADVVEAVENRHIGADSVLQIVTTKFAPRAVAEAVTGLLSEPVWSRRDLYSKIVDILGELQSTMKDRRPDISAVQSRLLQFVQFADVDYQDVDNACRELAGASGGGLLVISEGRIDLRVDPEELRRRLEDLTRGDSPPRRSQSFYDGTGPSLPDGPVFEPDGG